MITVSRPFLPPIKEYNELVKEIWTRNWLTNNGPLVLELENRLKEYLALRHILFLANGTVALQIAIKALELKGEIITTPFSYVATTSSIIWENCKPVFADINQRTFNIDTKKIEQCITEKTEAILSTHVYGNPCDVVEIKSIADRYNLKVIYDAAHCFGSQVANQSVLNHGDISTISFHATKLYHTIEGGAVITKDPHLNTSMGFLRNFGHNGPYRYQGIGINGKNSEFHAAMGLINLKYIDQILEKRNSLNALYDHYLDPLIRRGDIIKQYIRPNHTTNYAYYPIIIADRQKLLPIIQALENRNISTRRYFYPLLSNLDYIQKQNHDLSQAHYVSERILCLPFYHDLRNDDVHKICQIVLKCLL